jgi:glycosyltransferase involved in cell wall biosynthesis
VIYDAHTLLESELPYYTLGLSALLKRRIGRMLDGFAPRRADHVIAVSEAIRDQILAKGDVSPDRITVVASGMELDFSARIQDRAADTPQANFRVVYTGTLAPYQGIELLLRAFAQVVQKNDRARLVIVTGSSFDSYDDLAESLGIRGRIELVHGDLDAEITQLATASVLVNPRVDSTGLPQKLLNYMAAGKPIVSFVSSAPLLAHGRSGILVEDGNVDEFAQAILKLLDSPKLSLELGESAGAAARAEHTWDAAAQAVESIYRSLLAKKFAGRS